MAMDAPLLRGFSARLRQILVIEAVEIEATQMSDIRRASRHRVQDRREFLRKVRDYVVPLLRDFYGTL